MAGNGITTCRRVSSSTSPYNIASVILLFFLILVRTTITITMALAAEKGHSFPPAVTSREGSIRRNSMDQFTTRRASCNDNSKTDAIQISSTGRRGGPYRVNWRERVFNASAHEVPSGPNPISNR
ncbi:hypothetical protein F0562_029607 [Nyssa sinensis]|uniref:Uncharacterized protein n=1 Tax=Nyssa sinensis TaxID=561372 RepID=A0A5J5B5U7_9ASTE|nr:hypothetical protein F0562_029607 [Nyssa sinensis]